MLEANCLQPLTVPLTHMISFKTDTTTTNQHQFKSEEHVMKIGRTHIVLSRAKTNKVF